VGRSKTIADLLTLPSEELSSSVASRASGVHFFLLGEGRSPGASHVANAAELVVPSCESSQGHST
jgi:hypothetical protein